MEDVLLSRMPLQDCIEQHSVHEQSRREAEDFKWIESEKAGYDLGEVALKRWVRDHWWGFLREKWMEHLQGRRFWVELDRGDFGLLKLQFPCDEFLLDRIIDRIKTGAENLDIICWAKEWNIPLEPVIAILEKLDINGHRLVHQFDA